jgi:hypothetical protein
MSMFRDGRGRFDFGGRLGGYGDCGITHPRSFLGTVSPASLRLPEGWNVREAQKRIGGERLNYSNIRANFMWCIRPAVTIIRAGAFAFKDCAISD